jgi:NuA3 HAT complex component NTO1
LSCYSEENENSGDNILENRVSQALGEDVLVALCSLPAQRVDKRCFPKGNALWYYISLLYFSDRPNVSRTIPLSTAAYDEITQDLLAALGHESLDEILTRFEQEQKQLQATVSSLLPSVNPHLAIASSQEARIVELVKNKERTAVQKAYLQHEERRVMEKMPADNCDVCGGGDSVPPDDWIVICSGCEAAVHMQCFGIKALPDGDWFCDVCRLKPESPICALCLESKGILKSTMQEKNWPKRGNTSQKQWAHLYCARMLGVRYLFPASKDLLDLMSLSHTVWNHTCEVCGRRGGACVTCTVCTNTFHPGCWRKIHPNSPGPVSSSLLCRRHYPRISVTTIEIGESCVVNEVLTFSRLIIKRERDKKAKSSKQPFSDEENRSLLQEVEGYLRRVNSQHNFGFSITVQRSTGSLKVERPEAYNTVTPEALQYVDLKVPGRSQEQCVKQYATLYPVLVQRLRRTRVVLHENSQPQQVVKKRRLVKRHSEVAETLVRLPLGAVRDVSGSSTQDLSEDDLEAHSYT